MVKWAIGKNGADYQSEEFEYELIHENREEGKCWHYCDIQDF